MMSSQHIPSVYMSDRSVKDELYNVVGDFWEDTKTGDKRTLALEHRDGSLVYVWIPYSDASKKTSLFGSVITKRVTTEFFLSNDNLEKPLHELKLTTPQRSSCSVCDRTFSYPGNLTRHMKSHHST
jgi:hypothetical protein